jgi:4-diphosphocytidyl-2-C-methyl-D-erythritol kinase
LAPFLFMTLEKLSPCKVNLLLNILGRRPDGFHELETVMHPVQYCDRLEFARKSSGVTLTCDAPDLPADSSNLVHRAATAFLERAKISSGVAIRLEKRIPMAAGLGGGSGNAAVTLAGLNDLFGGPLTLDVLHELAASLGSDIAFFLQAKPALATGRGEKITELQFFPALKDAYFLLIYPGFGVSTPWAYKKLASFPAALNGSPGRAARLMELLTKRDLRSAAPECYNALEAPVLRKFPLLALLQEFLREQGAPAVLMSGSGSTTFAILESEAAARKTEAAVQSKFGPLWTAAVPCLTSS